MSDILLKLADRIYWSVAAASWRSALTIELEGIAAELRAEHYRIHSWAGLMQLLDDLYPAGVFSGESGDPGPRIVALIRENDNLRAELARMRREAS